MDHKFNVVTLKEPDNGGVIAMVLVGDPLRMRKEQFISTQSAASIEDSLKMLLEITMSTLYAWSDGRFLRAPGAKVVFVEGGSYIHNG